MSRDIGVSATALVVQTVVLAVQPRNVRLDVALLIIRHPESVREPSSSIEPSRAVPADSHFGGELLGTADGGDPGARSREDREELLLVLAVVAVAFAVGADAKVAGGEEEGDAPGAELGEAVADSGHVGERDRLLVVAVCESTLQRAIVDADLEMCLHEVETTLGREEPDWSSMY